ncbi:MAG: hypothetical protein A2487_15245 [Candidatus Raymondbacteria bacterium RifOxyC12_full_50_8]|uniref:Secretion system C-terminal sorting domain-containing protein n=1 Tax=Candidatus Raymondbacteria bacterium RIFOXYD12_FULL_49_13 TaxID=1817890 RepID=A0A1F7FK69_UNCRA|nr:MAG: hypothetical protein A2248_09465 [Candidatus Raymondbacteria bacterium RIFOXYA2_FULL_49_16]OGJ96339.1 MAG: hypothetical protein A2453_08425 [Candidatus Raymondbacteria bacterium RIFOXYC2_FULL_50_21]OGK03726.1 MAG: hypothetical protein A2487_15245 [Candidatus Raymondbacteria bacterium RifOxyC12_full_50_8]OGK06876.1 MAG: hypothetical protein A2519_11495 [Candidatus Raymondbacteria bacterium RIFOXYD12_FULL_49_13]OGP44031.1 MAG: hypothetical protein A2324_14085 [Candidatus Raymondbacteria b
MYFLFFSLFLASVPVFAVCGADTSVSFQLPSIPGHLLTIDQIEYKGAFRLPTGGVTPLTWQFGGQGLTFYPKGDPNGPDDGYPGSLFGLGHGYGYTISEISIPVPVISTTKNVNELNHAQTLQPFINVKSGCAVSGDVPPLTTQPHALGYLPKQGDQDTDKLYFSGYGDGYAPTEEWSRGWCSIDLSNPNPAGMWTLGTYSNFVAGNSYFQIPTEWANQYCPGKVLAIGGSYASTCGRLGCFKGPSLFAISPWTQGGPPAPGTALLYTKLLEYNDTHPIDAHVQDADSYVGGGWVEYGGKTAVIFFGKKDAGESYYGYPKNDSGHVVYDGDSTCKCTAVNCAGETYCWKTEGACGSGRGWTADWPRACIYLFDPDDIAMVAQGTMQPYEPKPYARFDFTDQIFDPGLQKRRIVSGAVDNEHGLFYAAEYQADGYAPIIHVFKVSGNVSVNNKDGSINKNVRITARPNPCNSSTVITITGMGTGLSYVDVYSVNGSRVNHVPIRNARPGLVTMIWDGNKQPSGIYIIKASIGECMVCKRLILMR